MNRGKAARFDVDTLRRLAGGKVFARGEDYFQHGQVELLAIESNRVLAEVFGSEGYRTELRRRGETIDGRCSCPAFADWGFCKHMVAVGLATNAVGPEETVARGALSRIRNHLTAKSVDSLAKIILELAQRDLQLFRRLLAAAARQADDVPSGE